MAARAPRPLALRAVSRATTAMRMRSLLWITEPGLPLGERKKPTEMKREMSRVPRALPGSSTPAEVW